MTDDIIEKVKEEVDDEETEKDAPNGFDQKEKDDMLAFLVEHFRDYAITRLWEKYAEVRNTKHPPKTYHKRFHSKLAPHIHLLECSVKTKLEIYKKYSIRVNKKYIEELKKHADVTFKQRLVVADFKMKNEPEKVEEPDELDGQMAERTPKFEELEVAEGDDYDSDDNLAFRKVTEKQKNNLWKFVLGNYKKYNKWMLFVKYAAFQGGRRNSETYCKRFDEHLAPQIHLANGSVETKLDICKEYKVRLSEESLKVFKKHADLTLNSDKIVVDYEMKDQPDAEEEPNGEDTTEGQTAGPSTRPKRTCRRMLDEKKGLDEVKKEVKEEEPDAVEEQIAEPPKRKRARAAPAEKPKLGRRGVKIAEDDDLIVDAVKPGSKKKGGSDVKKEQIAEPPKRKRARAAKASPAEKPKPKRGRKGAMIEEEVEDDDEVIVDAVKPGTGIPNPDMIIVIPKQEELVDDGRNFVMDQGYYYQGDYGMEYRLMAEMGMLRMDSDRKTAELKDEMKVMAENLQGFMKKEIESLKKDNKALAETVALLQKSTSDRPHESGDVDTVPNKKEGLLKLKDFVHSLNSPEIEEIKLQIDTAILDLQEEDKDPFPTKEFAQALDSIFLKKNQ